MEAKKIKKYHRDIINENEATDRTNTNDNDSSKSEESFLEDIRTFKKSFLAEINVFQKQLLTSYTTDNVIKSNNSDRMIIFRCGSRATTTSKMERFVIIVNGWKPLTIITKCSIFNVAAALDPPLILLEEESIAFLKDQTNKKDKVIDSLLNQLSKQND